MSRKFFVTLQPFENFAASGMIKFLLKELEQNRKQQIENRKKGFSTKHLIFPNKSGSTTIFNRQSSIINRLYLKLL